MIPIVRVAFVYKMASYITLYSYTAKKIRRAAIRRRLEEACSLQKGVFRTAKRNFAQVLDLFLESLLCRWRLL